LQSSKTSFVYCARLFFSLVQRISFKENQQKDIYYKRDNKELSSLFLSLSPLIIITLEIGDINNTYNFFKLMRFNLPPNVIILLSVVFSALDFPESPITSEELIMEEKLEDMLKEIYQG